EDVFTGLFLESGYSEQFIRTAEFFEFLDGLDLKPVVDGLGGLWPDARYSYELHQAGRNFPFEILEKSHFSRVDVLDDFLRQIVGKTRNWAYRTLPCQDFDVVRQILETGCRSPIGTNPEGIRTLNFQKIRDVAEYRSNLQIPHTPF